MKLSNKKGAALIISFYLIAVLIVFSSIIAVRALNENNMAKKERDATKAFYYSEGGSNAALDKLSGLINVDLSREITKDNPQTVANKAQSYATGNQPLELLYYYGNKSTQNFTINDARTILTYTQASVGFENGTYGYDVTITAKGSPVAIGSDKWDFSYFYKIASKGSKSGVSKNVSLSGDFTMRVQKDNFAKYALFTEHHTLKDANTKVWFNDNTYFAGPVQSNDQLNFSGNPIFDGAVGQQNNKACFLNDNNGYVYSDSDHNSNVDVPVFNQGYTRSMGLVNLESSVAQTDLMREAQGGSNITGNGVFVPNDGTNIIGGIFTRGDTTIQMSVDGSGNANYIVGANGQTKTVVVNRTTSKTTVKQSGYADVVYNGIPDGTDSLGTIIYTDGQITSLKGTVQKDTELTISSQSDINITDHIRYSDYTPASGTPGTSTYVPPSADGTTNLLGILSWGGDVIISTTAPANLDIHGVVMARNGVFQVDDYNQEIYQNGHAIDRGVVNLLGGVITQFYGAFGTFNSSTQAIVTGYGRNFTYDPRTGAGKSPPYFPSLKAFVAFTNDITDKVVWKEGA
ncbi:MAG: DUF4900 domain-containing protein [Candidatus Omnitrophica bacterium]|nr:DUF4900 domain-containing protein [Candidatus Omnitrophota bacterium]